MIRHWESTLNRSPNCPKNGVHLYLLELLRHKYDENITPGEVLELFSSGGGWLKVTNKDWQKIEGE